MGEARSSSISYLCDCTAHLLGLRLAGLRLGHARGLCGSRRLRLGRLRIVGVFVLSHGHRIDGMDIVRRGEASLRPSVSTSHADGVVRVGDVRQDEKKAIGASSNMMTSLRRVILRR